MDKEKNAENKSITLKAASQVLKLPSSGLRAVMRILKIEPKVGRSGSNRMALLLTPEQVHKIQEALK